MQVICEGTYDDNFQPHVVNSKRKRVECDAPNAEGSMKEHEETSRCNFKKAHERVTQNMIPHHAKKARISMMAAGTTVVLKSSKYPNKEDVAYASFVSSNPNAQVGGVAVGQQFWKVRVTYPMEENEELVRPWGNLKTLGDAKGKAIAWTSIFIGKVNG
ncbi:hypothetical protein QOZ80_1AG0017670 [Eleusine coracana subsp. coracana]|nr:hypothetical protein QOZ80_1AG0017670 [Eleusine coracana subsp. coracana]